jgi:ABC-type branched-subunit amino acid transport system ATPase component
MSSVPATRPGGGSALLEVSGLAAGYHGHPVVNDIDIDVAPGEVVLLVGPNGAGKTTTLMAIAGAIARMAGEVRFNGDIADAPLHKRVKQGLAFVTEQRAVFSRLSTEDNLRLGRGDRRLAFDMFPELEALRTRLGGQLSGGEQQMLVLGRALSRQPSLLLADELSLGLAPRVVTRLLSVVRRAASDQGLGVLLVEQHVTEALNYADRVYVLQRGRVVLAGQVSDVRESLEQAYLSGVRPDEPAGANGLREGAPT